MEYVASDLTLSKVLVVKARLLHAIALTELGYIGEAESLYRRVLKFKDLPDHGTQLSAYGQKLKGKNFNFELSSAYQNDQPPTSESNIAVIK